jgi:hypothetical protein
VRLQGLVLERSLLRPRDMPLACTIGDPVLAVSICLGVQITGQALSPTKIWHQLVIYPTMGTWASVAIIGGLMNACRTPFPVLIMILGLAIWAVTVPRNFRLYGSATLHSAARPKLDLPPGGGISPLTPT